MQLISKFNKRICFLLCFIDIFSKCAWIIHLNDKKGIIITNAFQKVLDESNHKPYEIWVYKDSEFYTRSIKSLLQDSDIEMYSTNNEGKPVVAETFIRTIKNKIYKYMTSVLKNVCFDKWDDIVNKYNYTYHRTIKMKPVDAKSSTYIDFNKKVINKILHLKMVIMLEYKNIKTFLLKVTFQIGLKNKKSFVIKKNQKWCVMRYVISDLNDEEIVGVFNETKLQKTSKK